MSWRLPDTSLSLVQNVCSGLAVSKKGRCKDRRYYKDITKHKCRSTEMLLNILEMVKCKLKCRLQTADLQERLLNFMEGYCCTVYLINSVWLRLIEGEWRYWFYGHNLEGLIMERVIWNYNSFGLLCDYMVIWNSLAESVKIISN